MMSVVWIVDASRFSRSINGIFGSVGVAVDVDRQRTGARKLDGPET